MARTFFESRHKHPNHLAFKNHAFLMGRYLTVFKTLEPLLHSFQRSRSF